MNQVATPVSRVHALHCAQCGIPYSPFELQAVSTCCQQPLVADYDLQFHLSRENGINLADSSMWRYGPLLPLLDEANKVTLGEGMTPLLALPSWQPATASIPCCSRTKAKTRLVHLRRGA